MQTNNGFSQETHHIIFKCRLINLHHTGTVRNFYELVYRWSHDGITILTIYHNMVTILGQTSREPYYQTFQGV